MAAARIREDRFKDLNMTELEIKKFQQSLKDENFCKLFAEYVEELSDPKNRQLYEREISALEAEQGNKVRFVNPTEGHVLKTMLIQTPPPSSPIAHLNPNVEKVFINMCTSPEINGAKAENKCEKGIKGQSWSIPYSLTNPREDVDHANKPCYVFDCVLHPDTYQMGRSSSAFDKMLTETAIEGIEKRFDIKLDRKIKTPKMKYKGVPSSTIIREPTKSKTNSSGETSMDYVKSLQKQQKKQQHEAKPQIQQSEIKKEKLSSLIQELDEHYISSKSMPVIETPKHTISHQGIINDYSKFTNERERREKSRPESLIVRVELPRVATVSEVNLDTTETTLELKVPQKYLLNIKLPFPVDNERGNAKFDKARQQLTVSLPVIPPALISVAAEPF